jgi:peptidoglycan/xylan/chitin deacetylase (PgdA/CDA1 family)
VIPSRPVTCLTYHDIADATGPATEHLGCVTSPAALRGQLDFVQAHYTVIDLSQLLAGDIPDRAALITFDDAYASVARIAAPMLAERQLPSVFFVNPGPVADTCVPLDVLASLVCSRYGVAALVRHGSDGQSSATTFSGFMDAFVARLGLAGLAQVKLRLLALLGETEAAVHAELGIFLTRAELAGLPATGMEIANHTLSHVHCGPLSRGELAQEVVHSRALIETITGRPVRAFAFPWGRHQDATADAMRVIRDSGHEATFLMHGRNNQRRPERDIWYRVLLRNETGAGLPMTLRVYPRLREFRARLR